jgi:hypothetical protein
MSSDTTHLREKLAAATKGPWSIGESSFFNSPDWAPINGEGWTSLAEVVVGMEGEPHEEGLANAALIVAAVNALPGLLDEVEGLRWMATRKDLGLYHHSPTYGDDEDQASEWRVDRISGPINDREWEIVGRGDTLAAALNAARAALGGRDDQ